MKTVHSLIRASGNFLLWVIISAVLVFQQGELSDSRRRLATQARENQRRHNASQADRDAMRITIAENHAIIEANLETIARDEALITRLFSDIDRDRK